MWSDHEMKTILRSYNAFALVIMYLMHVFDNGNRHNIVRYGADKIFIKWLEIWNEWYSPKFKVWSGIMINKIV